MRLDAASAGRLAALALACVGREFPNRPGHVMQRAGELDRPRELHPAFYGCFDWHSAVHGHWLLAHTLRRFPLVNEAGAIRAVLNKHLTAENLIVEARYLEAHPGFERPYGWAWLLKLSTELAGWDDAEAKRWSAGLEPLASTIESRYMNWLPKQTYPIRSGTHANTAFGLSFALDFSRVMKRSEFK